MLPKRLDDSPAGSLNALFTAPTSWAMGAPQRASPVNAATGPGPRAGASRGNAMTIPETTTPRVVTAPKKGARPPLGPAPELAWKILGWLGFAFTLVGGADLALTWYPWRFGNPEWEFGTVSAMLDGLPVATLGLVLLLAVGVATGRRWLVQAMAVILLALAMVIVLAAVLYATNVPIALRAVQEPLVRTGLKKAIAKSAVQATVYPLVLAWLGWLAWRRATKY